jgi:hypothetical protein
MAKCNAEDRLKEAEHSGAELLVTASALCLRSFGLAGKPKIRIQNLFEFLWQAV